MRNQYAVDPDDVTSSARVEWWESLPLNDAEPYEAAAWTYSSSVTGVTEESDEPSALADQDDLDVEGVAWWETIGGEGPKPYEAAAWAYVGAMIAEVEDVCGDTALADGTPIPPDLECPADDWWTSIGGEGPKPYATAAWQYLFGSDFILEIVAVSTTELASLDEGVLGDDGDPSGYDAGLFGSAPGLLIDGVFYTTTGYGIEVKRTFAEIKVYDSLASSPGRLPLITQPLGGLITEVGASEVLADGTAPVETSIELERLSNRGDDRPPGQLLGQVNYEIFGAVATITSWDHYNWEDDTPVRKAVLAMLNGLPDGVLEVRVLDEPTALWQSLGFSRAYKGDPYIHYFPG